MTNRIWIRLPNFSKAAETFLFILNTHDIFYKNCGGYGGKLCLHIQEDNLTQVKTIAGLLNYEIDKIEKYS